MAVPNRILELVDRFKFNEKNYKSGDYNEAQVRIEFINPFFEALGWDVTNSQGYAEAYKDVINEDKVKVAGATKAPDYSFRIGGARKFFLEAKKPSVNLKDDIHPAYQLRRYAWSAKLPLSVLTDFEELAVYDCRVRPGKADKASVARTMYYNYKQYSDVWDEIQGIFSREAILKGSFDKYAESAKRKKGTAEVDDAFLNEMEQWRELLARNFALRNKDLSPRALNEVVQKTIDRIVFLRICEDRGIESYGQLQKLINVNDVYSHLRQIFLRADDRYNSGLFHFRSEGGRDDFDNYSLDLNLDDKPVKDIIKRLYYPESPYEFSVLPADILGHVYERFLGKVIRLTAGHKAKIEEKPEVRKAGGVYYTPTYIVDYIVKNTVGKLLEDKTPKQAEKLTILDPACGSGSFLIGAYRYLLDWHLEKYTENPGKHKKGKEPKIYQSSGRDWKLTTSEKKKILLNNIYGVDIDSQAVEVTKLSLLLKVLEGETDETLRNQMKLFEERALPDLGSNIKCGNSLIGSDFYEGSELSLFDEEEMYRINVFDWEDEFRVIMQNGGFDAVIGNPPYFNLRTIENQDEKDYLRVKYDTIHTGYNDIFYYFIYKSLNMLSVNGLFGMITSNYYIGNTYSEKFRIFLREYIKQLLNFKDYMVFKDASIHTNILFCSRNQNTDIVQYFEKGENFQIDSENLEKYFVMSEVEKSQLQNDNWIFSKDTAKILIDKLYRHGWNLGDGVVIKKGATSGGRKIFTITKKTASEYQIEEDLLKISINSSDIFKYFLNYSDKYLLYIDSKIDIENYPNTKAYLEQYYEKLSKRNEVIKKTYPWYRLERPRVRRYFEAQEKIVVPYRSEINRFALDNQSAFNDGGGSYCIVLKDDLQYEIRYILGILNSKCMDWLYGFIGKPKGKSREYFNKPLEKLPIRTIDFNNPDDVAKHDKMVELVEQMLELNKKVNAPGISSQEKKILQKQIDITDKLIDKLVYELYGLTDEEVGIVEGGE